MRPVKAQTAGRNLVQYDRACPDGTSIHRYNLLSRNQPYGEDIRAQCLSTDHGLGQMEVQARRQLVARSERERGGGEGWCELKARMHLQPNVEATCEHGPTDRAARYSLHRKKGARYAPRTPMAYLVTKRREKLW